MGLFLSSGCYWVLSAVLCSEVCPGKASMFSRRQSCRGKSQSPVVRIAEEMETEPSKPIDKISRGENTSHRAVSKENALWPRKKYPRGPSLPPKGEGSMSSRILTDYGCSPRRGGSDGTVTRTCGDNGEEPHVPAPNRP